jgi:hypothetical protein
MKVSSQLIGNVIAALAASMPFVVIGAGTQTSAPARFVSGEIVQVELHWYEAAGIGKRELKIKAFR